MSLTSIDNSIELKQIVTGAELTVKADKLNGSGLRISEYGHLRRGLCSRHIQFLGIGAIIGTGLFVGSGDALIKAGPVSLLVGYVVAGVVFMTVIQCVGAVSTFLPIPGGLVVYAKRFVSDDFAFAVGINYWLGGALLVTTKISTTALILTYWTSSVHLSIWTTIVFLSIYAMNMCNVRQFGEAEFILTSSKITTVIGLLVLSLVLDIGGNPQHDRIGFRYWGNPGPMIEYLQSGHTGRLLGLTFAFCQAVITYGGGEVIAVAAGETVHPSYAIPRACKKVIMRILIAYLLGIFFIGLLIASNDPDLIAAVKRKAPGAAASPFVIAIKNMGISVLPHIVNVATFISSLSSANSYVYASSRSLYALSIAGQAPRIFARCGKSGTPYNAILSVAAISLLSYLSALKATQHIFTWVSSLSNLSGLFNWTAILCIYLRFRRGTGFQGITYGTVVGVKGAPHTVYWALSCTLFVILAQGFPVFFGTFQWSSFILKYGGTLLFIVPFLSRKALKRSCRLVKYGDMDFVTGKAAVAEHELECHVPAPRTLWDRVILFLA